MAKATPEAQAILSRLAKVVVDSGILGTRSNAKGKEYFTTGTQHFSPVDYRFTGADGREMVGKLGGFICFNLNQIRDSAQAEAATVENATAAVARLSPEQKAALLEQLMAE